MSEAGPEGRPPFTGVGVALVTLFTDGGAVDVPATADLAARLVDAGMRSVVVAGSTGEASSLDADERVRLVRGVRDAVPGGIPVIAGTGSTTGRWAAALTTDAVDAGADAVLVLSPPGVVDVRPYYETVATAAGQTPVLAYHYPPASSPGIAVDALAGLPVQGLKDSSGDPERLLGELETLDAPVYVGASSVLTMAGSVGAAGAILTLANAEPELCVAAFEGSGQAQRDLLEAHLRATRDLPHGVKGLVAERFGTSTCARIGA